MYVCIYANSKSPTNDSYMVHIKRHIGSNIAMKINIQKHLASDTTRYVVCIPVNTKFLIFQNPRPINMNPSTNIYTCPRRTQLILLHREAISSQDWQDVCMYIHRFDSFQGFFISCVFTRATNAFCKSCIEGS
jgi:hypothetical protein